MGRTRSPTSGGPLGTRHGEKRQLRRRMSAAMLVLAYAAVAALLLLALCVVHKTIDCAGLAEWTSDDGHGPLRFDSTILLKEGPGAMAAGPRL